MTLTGQAQKVSDALKNAGISAPEKAKKVDDNDKLAALLGKGQVASVVASLSSKEYFDVGGASRANAYRVKK